MKMLAWAWLLLVTGCRIGGAAAAVGDARGLVAVDPPSPASVARGDLDPDVPVLWQAVRKRAEAAEAPASGVRRSGGFVARPLPVSETLAARDYSNRTGPERRVRSGPRRPLTWAQRFLRSVRPYTTGDVRRWIDDIDPAYAEELLRRRSEEHRFEVDYLSASIVGGVSFAGRARYGNDRSGWALQGDADWDPDLAGEHARFGPRFDALLPLLDDRLEFEAAYTHEVYSGVGTLSVVFRVRYW